MLYLWHHFSVIFVLVQHRKSKTIVAALNAWNRLPTDLRLARFTVSFKIHLKAFSMVGTTRRIMANFALFLIADAQ